MLEKNIKKYYITFLIKSIKYFNLKYLNEIVNFLAMPSNVMELP